MERAGRGEQNTFEDFDWDVPISFDRDLVRDLPRPGRSGEDLLACFLGHSACRAGHKVLFLRSDHLHMRVLHSWQIAGLVRI